jgi:hypothetical protein
VNYRPSSRQLSVTKASPWRRRRRIAAAKPADADSLIAGTGIKAGGYLSNQDSKIWEMDYHETN